MHTREERSRFHYSSRALKHNTKAFPHATNESIDQMKITTFTIAVLAGLLFPAFVEGQPLSLRYFKCEIGAACRDYDGSGDKHGTFVKSTETLFDCAEECDDDEDCYG